MVKSRTKNGTLGAMITLIIVFTLVNIGKNNWVNTTLSDLSVVLGIVITALILTYETASLTLSFRNKFSDFHFQGHTLKRLFVSYPIVLIGALTCSIPLSISFAIFISTQSKFFFALALDWFLFLLIYGLIKKLSAQLLTNNMAGIGAKFISTIINYFLLSLVFLIFYAVNIQKIDPGSPVIFEMAHNFEHGSHFFEVLARVSTAVDLALQSFSNYEGIYGIAGLLVALFSLSVTPFIALTLLYRFWLDVAIPNDEENNVVELT